MVRKALGLMEMGPREATQGELQGKLRTESRPQETCTKIGDVRSCGFRVK